jgi:hypothetical protein
VNLEDIMETDIWQLYQKGQDYHRITGIYEDTDRNYRMYNGDQWGGAKLGGIEPVQKNFIKPIVKYKLSVIHDNLYRAVFSSMNYDNKAFRQTAEKCCKLLNGYIERLWEQDKMDDKLREVTEDAAINDEGIVYIFWDEEESRPVHQVVKKNDIYYGDENDEDIQSQPYILIRKRMSVVNAIDLAMAHGVSNDKLHFIIGDNDNLEETGEASQYEVDNRVTVVYKMFKRHGTVKFSIATRYVDIAEDEETSLKLYPVAHMTWERKAGSARGEGEVRYLIPNQIEVNRTEMRRVLTVREQAYPIRVVDVSKVENPEALDTVGGTIHAKGQTVDDVNKIIGTVQPAQMSNDVKELQESLIQVTRDLAGAGDTATGQVNPEAASGRAILAVQQASHAPMTAQKEKTKSIIEDISKIDLEYLIVNSENGIDMLDEETDPNTGEESMQMVNVPQSVWEQLQATVKVDVTPKGVYDRFALEQTLENLLTNGLFSEERFPEFETYVEALPDDAVAPKQILEGIVKRKREERLRIATMDAQAQLMQQRAQQFLMEDPDGQAQQIADAESQLMAQEAEYAEQEAELDEETAEAEAKTDEE